MLIWSKGLGRITLTVDLRQSEVKWENDTVVIRGWVRVPVVWNYQITFEDYDIKGLIKLVANRSFLRFLWKSLLTSVRRRT